MSPDRPRLAVVGGGAAGMVSAWGLSSRFAVTLYERAAELGGTVRTIHVDIGGREVPVETGFTQFVPAYFPRFAALLDQLGVASRPSSATLTVGRSGAGDFVWPPRRVSHLMQLARERGGLATVREFVKLNRAARSLVERRDWSPRLRDWAEGVGLSASFITEVLLPFTGTSRGLSPERAGALAAYPLLAYMIMPSTLRPPSWRVVDGGARRYIDALAARLKGVDLRLSTPVRAVLPGPEGRVRIVDEGGEDEFDAVVVATEVSAARELLAEHPDARSRVEALHRLDVYSVENVVHSDPRLMPVRRADWSSANVVAHGEGLAYSAWAGQDFGRASLFRGWTTGPGAAIEEVRDRQRWRHVAMTPEVAEVQAAIEAGQGAGGLWLAGLYTVDIDSHESALRSALRVVEALDPRGATLTALRAAAPN